MSVPFIEGNNDDLPVDDIEQRRDNTRFGQVELDLGLPHAYDTDAFSRNRALTLLPGLSNLAHNARQSVRGPKAQRGACAVVFFDLAGSTQFGLARGNYEASRNSLVFTWFTAEVVQSYRGRVVKTMGDGVLAVFGEFEDACLAALNVRIGASEHLSLECTVGLTSGTPLSFTTPWTSNDVFGDVVNRAARIQSLARGGQVLMDKVLYDQVRAFLVDRADIIVSSTPQRSDAKGLGELELYEVAVKPQWKLRGHLATPYRVSLGRPNAIEKVAILEGARSEIIEVGIGLTSFAGYFSGERPSSFRDPIRKLVRQGVALNCYALDPAYVPGVSWLSEQGDVNYGESAERARLAILAEAQYARMEHFKGKVTYSTYARVPEFWCLGVDVDDPVDGRMFFSSYMMGVSRSEMAVTQVSRQSHPALYDQYMLSVQAVRENASSRQAG